MSRSAKTTKARATRGDPNLQQATDSNTAHELQWHNPRSAPFQIEGLPWLEENKDYGRLPKAIRPQLRESLAWVAMQPSGVVIRFRCCSKELAIKVKIDRNEHFPQNPLAAESGFDVYLGTGRKQHFHKNLSATKPSKQFTTSCGLPDDEQDVCIYFPILNPVISISIGLSPDAAIHPPKKHKRKRILFYGSSITQGFCCSRPGLTYPARVCRTLDAELVNMGFGGNAKGDTIVAEQFAEHMKDGAYDAFVYDYDHNTPSPAWLRQTHEPFFKIIRKQNPALPTLVLSSPVYKKDSAYFGKRLAEIERTVQRAKKRGDKHIRLLAGKKFWPSSVNWQDCTVDNLHPNDQGFALMAESVTETLKKMLT